MVMASLIVALVLPFSGMNLADAAQEDKAPKFNQEECFERITESIADQEDRLELKALKKQAKENSKFIELKGDKDSEFKNTIQYWKADPEKCTVKLSQIDVKYDVEKGTENHKELIVSVDGDSKQVIKTELQEPFKVKHTNYSGNTANWSGISQMDGTSSSSSEPTKVRAYFDVPYPSDPSGFNCGTGDDACIVSVWAGLSEDIEGNDTMIQSGTDSVCEGNNCGTDRDYYAWLEKVDATPSQDKCTSMDVSSGDSIRTWTYYYDSSNKYSTGVYNYDEHDICSISYTNEYEDAHYGQFIVERPSWNGLMKLPSFSDFYMEGEIMIDGTYEGIGDYSSIGHTWKHDMKNGGTTNISTSWPNTSDDIYFNYISSSGTD